MGIGGLWMFLRDEVEEPFSGLLLAGESNRRENGGSEPWGSSLGESSLQRLVGFGRVGLG